MKVRYTDVSVIQMFVIQMFVIHIPTVFGYWYFDPLSILLAFSALCIVYRRFHLRKCVNCNEIEVAQGEICLSVTTQQVVACIGLFT